MTTTSSTTTGSISSAGIGSGLDVKGIISSLMGVESQPLQLLQNQASTVSTEISAVGQIQSEIEALVFGDVTEGTVEVVLQVGQRQVAGFDRHRSGFDLREVEDVVDQRQQIVSGSVDRLGEVDVLGG